MRISRNYLLAAAFLAASFVSIACGGPSRTGSVTTPPEKDAKPPSAAPSQAAKAASPEPGVGDRLIVPELVLDGDHLLIAYRHTVIGYESAYGFDTHVYRFRKNADGSLSNLAVTKRLMGGEELVDSREFPHVDERVSVQAFSGGEPKTFYTLILEGEALLAEGGGRRFRYYRDGQGALHIDRSFGQRSYTEVWRRDGSSIVDSRGPSVVGRFEGEWPKPKRYVARPDNDPSGGSDLEFDFFETGGRIKVAANGPEPIAELLVLDSGSSAFSSLDLETLALIDLCFEGDGTVTPLLARAFLASD